MAGYVRLGTDMADKKTTVKINTNPNKTPAKGSKNPTQKAWAREEANEPVYEKYGYPKKKTIKINSSNHQPRIGGSGGIGGGRIGGDFLDQTK